MQERITPPHITHLEPGEIFVFGSNNRGIHGKGAALMAKEKFGAELGVGSGPTGRCYAIPTKWYEDGRLTTCSLFSIELQVWKYLKYTKEYTGLKFLTTEIGCGLAGYKPEQIAPMFAKAINFPNVWLPESFIKVINNQ